MSVADFLSETVGQGQAVKLLEELIESSPIGELLVAPDSHLIVYANRAAADMWGVHDPVALADGVRTIHELVPEEVRPRHEALVNGWFERPHRLLISKRGPIPGVRIDTGEIFKVRIQLAPVYVGPSLAFLPTAGGIKAGLFAAAYVMLVEEWGELSG